MTTKYIIDNYNHEISIKNPEIFRNTKKIGRIIKSSIKRRHKKDLISLDFSHKIRKCNFCRKDDLNYVLIISVEKDIIKIDGIKYMLDVDGFEFSNCKGKDCSSKKLNANSVEYVSIGFNIDKNLALKLIHKRNSSPIYKENHTNNDDFIKSQGSTWKKSKLSKEEKKEKNKNGRDKCSLSGYISKYGYDKGNELYNDMVSKKAISLDNMIRVHGKDKGLIIYNNWKSSIGGGISNKIKKYGETEGKDLYKKWKESKKGVCTKDWYIKKYGATEGKKMFCIKNLKSTLLYDLTYDDFINEIKNRIERKSLFYKKTINFDIIEKDFSVITHYAVSNNIDVDIPINELLCHIDNKYKLDKEYFKKGKYSWFVKLENGSILRSSHEYKFYKMLKSNSILFEVEKKYEKSKMKCDFYINNEIFVEIAGMMTNNEYRERMMMKQKKFGSLLIIPERIDEFFCDYIKGQIKYEYI